jgi:tRNA (cmo5U34)-methyltransferase
MSDLHWSEENSQHFIDYAAYYVPDRLAQLETICALIPATSEPFHVVELCCGEGLLARAILERFAGCCFHGYDGSRTMLEKTRTVLQPFADRVSLHPFDLAAADWRSFPWPVQAVVSSLAIHHLDGDQKRELYRDLYRLLNPGGALIIADLIQPAHPAGVECAARAWDEAVREAALAQAGGETAFEVFQNDQWNIYHYPDPMDKPSGLYEQLRWLEEAGFSAVDVYWLKAGHAIYGGWKMEYAQGAGDLERA